MSLCGCFAFFDALLPMVPTSISMGCVMFKVRFLWNEFCDYRSAITKCAVEEHKVPIPSYISDFRFQVTYTPTIASRSSQYALQTKCAF